MDALDGTPKHILGYTIRSHTRIYVSYLIPSFLELFVYIVQFFADTAVSYQHFHSGQPFFGYLTLLLILAPPVLCFLFVITSPEQWNNPIHSNKKRFISYQLTNLLLFPICAAYRYSRRIFWSVEALFHDNDDKERMNCLAKAGECSTCELNHLLQAYVQSAPQIILQLYHMLTQDLFRNYNTTTVQAISLVFSAIDLAAITVTYQRFESQKLAGRPYPWAVPNQFERQRQRLIAVKRLREENERKRRESERKISEFPENNKIMENFKLRNSDPDSRSHDGDTKNDELTGILVHVNGEDEVDNDAISNPNQPFIAIHSPQSSLTSQKGTTNSTDDEKINSNIPKLRRNFSSQSSINLIEECDMVPETLPPPLPIAEESFTPELRTQTSNIASNVSGGRNRLSATANRISTFKDMLWLNAQLYIQDNVPRPPKMLTPHIEDKAYPMDQNDEDLNSGPKGLSHDEIDFFIPQQRKIINGIEQDDFAGKLVAFLGWLTFICMRMLALSTFCVFFTRGFFIVLGSHYVLMLFWLLLESRFQDKLNRTFFYALLAYVYIFVILEFRIKFKHIRMWYVGYFLVVMGENLAMTLSWWIRGEFESWWFNFMYDCIIYSGTMFSLSLIVYYCILKPNDVVYVLEENK